MALVALGSGRARAHRVVRLGAAEVVRVTQVSLENDLRLGVGVQSLLLLDDTEGARGRKNAVDVDGKHGPCDGQRDGHHGDRGQEVGREREEDECQGRTDGEDEADNLEWVSDGRV